MAPPEEGGRFFYNTQLTGFNFTKHQGELAAFLGELLRVAGALMIGWPMFGAEAHANPAGGGGWYANPKPDAMPDASG
jgi:hypothetical protein